MKHGGKRRGAGRPRGSTNKFSAEIRAAAAAVAYASGGRPDPAMLALYGTLADRQRRLAEPLGWSRTARDVTDKTTEPTQW